MIADFSYILSTTIQLDNEKFKKELSRFFLILYNAECHFVDLSKDELETLREIIQQK